MTHTTAKPAGWGRRRPEFDFKIVFWAGVKPQILDKLHHLRTFGADDFSLEHDLLILKPEKCSGKVKRVKKP